MTVAETFVCKRLSAACECTFLRSGCHRRLAHAQDAKRFVTVQGVARAAASSPGLQCLDRRGGLVAAIPPVREALFNGVGEANLYRG